MLQNLAQDQYIKRFGRQIKREFLDVAYNHLLQFSGSFRRRFAA